MSSQITTRVAQNELTDAHLLSQYVKENDECAFERMFQRYHGLVYHICRQHLRSYHALIDDAVQCVFLVLMKKAPSLHSRKSLSGWIHRVCMYVSKDIARSERCRKQREQRLVEDHSVGNGRALVMDEQGKHTALLYEALDSLGERDRSLLVNHYLMQCSYRDMAQELKCSEVVVRKRVSRACGRLRKKMAGHGVVWTGAMLMAALEARAAQIAQVPTAQSLRAFETSRLTINTAARACLKQLKQRAFFAFSAKSVVALGIAAPLIWGATRYEPQGIEPAARIEAVSSDQVFMLKKGQTKWRAATLNEAVRVGNRLRTTETGQAAFSLPNGSIIQMREHSELTLSTNTITLHRGALHCTLTAPLTVRTHDLKATVMAGTCCLMRTGEEAPFSRLDCWQGRAEVTPIALPDRAAFRLSSGQAVSVGSRTGLHIMSSDLREMSPTYGGQVFRDCASTYAAGRFMLETRTFKPDRVLVELPADPPMDAWAHGLRYGENTLALETFNRNGDAVRVLTVAPPDSRLKPRKRTFHHIYHPLDQDARAAYQLDAVVHMEPHPNWRWTSYMIGLGDPMAENGDVAKQALRDTNHPHDAYPELVPELKPTEAFIPFLSGWSVFRQRALFCGRRADGRRIYEHELITNDRLHKRFWVCDKGQHAGFHHRELTLRFAQFRISCLEME